MKFQEWEINLDKENIKRLEIPNHLEFEKNKLVIKDYPKLKYLDVHGAALRQLQIANCSDLKTLILNHNQLEYIGGLRKLTKLVRLEVTGNKLKALVELKYLINLKHLYCSNNELTKLDVSNLKNLISLYCFDNQLITFDCSNLENLEDLNCSRNFNKKVKINLIHLDLKGCENLKFIDADMNDLRDLSCFSYLPNLVNLSLKLNGSYNLENSPALELNSPNLQFLDTSRSNIKNVKFIQPSPHVKIKEDEDYWSDSEDASTEWEQYAYERQQKERQKKYFQQQSDETTSPDQEPVVEAANFKEPHNKNEEVKLTLSHMWMSGKLVIKDWPRLVQLNVGNNQLEELVVENCPNLIWLNYAHNKIKKEPQIINCPKLKEENIHKENCGNWEVPEPPTEEENPTQSEYEKLKAQWEEVIKKILDDPYKYSLDDILKIDNSILRIVSSDLRQKFIDLVNSIKKMLEKNKENIPPEKDKQIEPEFDDLLAEIEKIKNGSVSQQTKNELKEKIINSQLSEEQKEELLKQLEGLTKKTNNETEISPSTPLHYWGWLFVIVGWIVLVGLFILSLRMEKKRKI